ncbi:hypothetical protein ACS0TY_001209 [Phlomoides rotata]
MRSNGCCFISRSISISRQIHVSSYDLNAKIKTFVQQGKYEEALKSYSKILINLPSDTSRFTFPSLLKACASLSHFHYGTAFHSTIIKMGLQSDPYIVTSLIRTYVKCASLGNAVKLFDNMSDCETCSQDVALWNSIIDGYSKSGFFEEVMAQFRRMQALNIKPDGYTLCIFLGMRSFFDISYGKEIHGYIIRNMFDDDSFVITALIDMYSNFSRPMEAWNVFQKLENKDSIVIWNAMINGFCENGVWRNCLQLYSLAKCEGLELGSTTFSSVLTACSQGEAMDFGSQLHCDMIKNGVGDDAYASTSLLTFYSKCGDVKYAERVFRLTRNREVGIWNSMISAYINRGFSYDALDIYTQMRGREVSPDSFTISNILTACGMIGSSYVGGMVHGELIKRPVKHNVAVESALLTMYSKLGNVKDAHDVFDQMKEKDVIAWGSIISGSCENKEFEEVLRLYKRMVSDGVKPDPNIIASALIACVAYGDGELIKLGGCFHGLAIKEGLDLDAFTGSSLIEFYSKCGEPNMAREAFSKVLQKNMVVWNTLISCYSQNDLPDVSISLLPQILQFGLRPDSVSIITVLGAVSQMAALLIGKSIHGYYTRSLLRDGTQVENTLIDMYIKCGCLTYGERVFHSMSNRNLVAWNSMIGGLGSNGECHKAIDMFHEMRSRGTEPDEITFVSLLSSCNHGGLVDEGLHIFRSMKGYGVEPNMLHYVNIVDLLGRGGYLDEAREFIENMEIPPGRGVWLSLLSACRVHGNVELGEMAAENLIKMESQRGSNYIQLLNLYVEAGLKEKAVNLRAVMREKGLMKLPGCSWIEIKNKVEVFFSGDSSSPETTMIYGTLDGLKNSMKRRECEDEEGETIYGPG